MFGSVKKSLGRKPKCQCKHHQQKLLQKQEEQRQQLQAKLAQSGVKRAINTTYNKPYSSTVDFLIFELTIQKNKLLKLLSKTVVSNMWRASRMWPTTTFIICLRWF